MDNHADILEIGSSRGKLHDLHHVSYIDPSTYGDRVNTLWEHIKTQEYAFDDFSRGSPAAFLYNFTDENSLHFEVGDMKGYITVSGAKEKGCAEFHCVVWDRQYPFSDVIKGAREIGDYLFRDIRVERTGS
jgi:hypothetical protein